MRFHSAWTPAPSSWSPVHNRLAPQVQSFPLMISGSRVLREVMRPDGVGRSIPGIEVEGCAQQGRIQAAEESVELDVSAFSSRSTISALRA
jgi:hypothetical protein